MQKLFIFIFSILLTLSCSTKTPKQEVVEKCVDSKNIKTCSSDNKKLLKIDPWNGKYLHFSQKFEMLLNHISEESVAVDIYPVFQPDKFTSNFFAEIKNNEAIFTDRYNPNCRVNLTSTSEGIIVTNHCGGDNKDSGLYTRKDKGNLL